MSHSPLIAVIDDDAGVRVSLDSLMRSLGYRVAAFSSAEDFLASGAACQSDCVISDLRMTGMNGISLASRMRDTGLSAPVILLSAFLDDATSQRARDAGVRHFLKKPFDGDVMIRCLEAALSG